MPNPARLRAGRTHSVGTTQREDAMILLTPLAHFEPETAAFFGVEGYDRNSGI